MREEAPHTARPTPRGRLGWLALILLVAGGLAAWISFGVPAMRRDRIDTASAAEIVRLAKGHEGDARLVETAARQLIARGDPRDALSLLSDSKLRISRFSVKRQAALEGLRAEAEILAGDRSAGIADADSAMALDPNCLPAMAARAFWSERQAQWSDAQAQLETVVAATPDDGAARYHLAHDLIRQGEYVTAARVIQAAIKRQPASYDDRVTLATAQAYEGQFRDAAETFLQALRLRPASFEARANVARAEAFAARTAEACQQQEAPMSRLLKNDPDPDLDNEILGMLEIHAGDTVAAQRRLEAAARVYRAKPLSLRTVGLEILRNLTIIHIFNGKDAQASRDMRDAESFFEPIFQVSRLNGLIAQDPDDSASRLRLAELYEKLGALPEALDQYDELIRRHTEGGLAAAHAARIAALPDAPEPDTDWAWRVLSTESGLKMPSKV